MWSYRARLIRPTDGDTFRAELDLGFNTRTEQDLRLLGVHAPELSQPGGPETRDFVAGWFAGCDPTRRWPLQVTTSQTRAVEPSQRQTFTRYLAVVWRYGEQPTGLSLNNAVVHFLAAHPDWPAGQ